MQDTVQTTVESTVQTPVQTPDINRYKTKKEKDIFDDISKKNLFAKLSNNSLFSLVLIVVIDMTMTNEELVARIRAGIDTANNMLKLWEQNQGMIRKLANKYNAYAELDDLLQEGYIGLCSAVDGYNPDEGPFINYAILWIRQSMRRHIENSGSCIRIPVHMRRRIQEYRKSQQLFIQKYAREATDMEMRRFLGLSRKEYESLKNGLRMANVISLDAPLASDEDGESSMMDIIPASCSLEDAILDKVQNEELKAVLWPMVDSLPDDQAELIRKQYNDKMSLNGAAASIGVTPSKARTITYKGLRTLRHPRYTKQLRPFLPEKVEIMAYRGSVQNFQNTWTSSTEKAAMKLIESDL